MLLPAGLSWHQRLTLGAHLLKAVTAQHHRPLAPLFARYLPPEGVAIDVGAHAGQYTKLLARLAPRGAVHAIEPGAYARFILTAAIRLNGLGNVTVHPVGLSDRAGELELSVPVKARGGLGFGLAHFGPDHSGRTLRREPSTVTTLDALVRALGLDRVNFIKVDIEGWESRFLTGAQQTLTRFRPALLIEVVADHLARAGAAPGDIWARFAGLGYASYRLAPNGATRRSNGYRGDGDYLFVAADQSPPPGEPADG